MKIPKINKNWNIIKKAQRYWLEFKSKNDEFTTSTELLAGDFSTYIKLPIEKFNEMVEAADICGGFGNCEHLLCYGLPDKFSKRKIGLLGEHNGYIYFKIGDHIFDNDIFNHNDKIEHNDEFIKILKRM